MHKVVRDAAFQAYLDASADEQLGTRLKQVRDQPLTPGGRVHMTLFERVSGGRPHPRMRFAFVDVADPSPPGPMLQPAAPPRTAAALREAIATALSTHAAVLAAEDVADQAPKLSPHYWRNRIRARRTAALFQEIRGKVEAWLADRTLPASERAASHRAVAELEDEAYAGPMEFDDADTGTYHSYGHDKPFVHYLEAILGSLPEEGSPAMAVSFSSTREAIRRQRDQARNHLDFLMRHKYAYEVVEETDIEHTVGGFLIDRASRRIVSEAEDSDPLAPSYVLLRIAPSAEHDAAGQWVYRDAEGTLHLQTHEPVPVDPSLVRSAPVELESLTFQRAPKHPNLRRGLRLDWDDNGWVQQGRIDWVSWAGHCDIKAVMESLGVTLTDEPTPTITEYRSDTGQTTVYGRDLLLEMVASVLELGSVHSLIDGTGRLSRGIHHFGGSRNDSLPDRLQFTGTGPGRSFRWPMRGREDSFQVTSVQLPDGTQADMGTVFFRHLPDTETVTFAKNPRYIKTVEGDYNIIDVTGTVLKARLKVDAIDPLTGYPVHKTETTTMDLRPDADPNADGAGRYFLGTHLDDVGERKIFRVYYVPTNRTIVAEMFGHVQVDGTWTAQARPSEDMVIELRAPLHVTLSREVKRDDPSQFTALLQLAQRQAQNICADTDKEAAVWNGVVTRIDTTKRGANADARTEHWKVDIKARFGDASLEYLVRRDERGVPEAYCPATSETHWGHWPDFLWQDIGDVTTKGLEADEWVVNESMLERELIEIRVDESVASGFYVYDDHVKNVYELIWAGLAGYTHTVVHENKRYGHRTAQSWQAAVDRLEALRGALSFSET